jgi:hypothetical protein
LHFSQAGRANIKILFMRSIESPQPDFEWLKNSLCTKGKNSCRMGEKPKKGHAGSWAFDGRIPANDQRPEVFLYCITGNILCKSLSMPMLAPNAANKFFIGPRLSVRDFMEGMRGAGVDTGGPAPFTPRDGERFANQLTALPAKGVLP